jgi:2-polyprenyl-3-methyl-5-hydroxy-6-metoxy-1,4-benzoquinol methylase
MPHQSSLFHLSAESSQVTNQSASSGRILVFILAYHAEKQIASVFDRIPKELYNNDQVHFLMIDDASADTSATVGSQWVTEHNVSNVTVLRNPVNQGYGGNQKLGYRLAIDAGFDFVIMLHGDGQYAPELLPQFIRTWRQTDADVVLGSRMQDLKTARAGGMPLYKMAGNRCLTWFQNKLTGQHISEYHTGYRGYSTRFLRSVPFEINTNDFHFDTEILLQADYVAARIEEFPIPTRYGDETCHVNGLKYAKDVIFQTLNYKMHRLGMLCLLKYRDLTPLKYQNKTEILYSSHAKALDAVRDLKPARLLDMGCGPGFVAQRCEQMGAAVTGLDMQEPLPKMMSHFHKVQLGQDPMPLDPFDFDMVLMLDIVEHLQDPESFLVGLRNQSTSLRAGEKAPLMVLSTPNVGFIAVRLNLLLGRFNYAERGILDITHKRLFTKSSLLRMLRDCGYEVERVIPIGVPFAQVIPGVGSRLLGWISQVLATLMPRLFSFQFMLHCRPRPGIRQILKQSEAQLPGSKALDTFL